MEKPTEKGNAPISKKDGKPVEIYRNNQEPNGPFEEMHRSDHRPGKNYVNNHPNYKYLKMKVLTIRPYIGIGEFCFGTKREVLLQELGAAKSACMYGFPVENRYLDDYGYFHILCNKQELLEAVEVFPALITEETWLEYNGKK